MIDKPIPERVIKQIAEWRRLQRWWFGVHYACGVVGIVAAILASKSDSGSNSIFLSVPWLWGIIAAISTAVVTFLGPLQKGDSYKHAYYRMSNASDRYQSIENVDVRWLLNEHKASQQIVLNQDANAGGHRIDADAPGQ